MAMSWVLMGPPGVGKGTQASRLVDAVGALHVSTGDLLRAALAEGTPEGERAREYVESGRLVPDELIGDLLAARLSREDPETGVILDGFPRTVAQIAILDATLERLGRSLDGAAALIVEDRDEKRPFDPARKIAPRLKAAAFEAGLMCYPMQGTRDGAHGDHVLLAPPFILGEDEIGMITERLAGALETALG